MSAVSVIESTQWDPNAISFSTLRKNKNGGENRLCPDDAGQEQIFLPPVAVHALTVRFECLHG